MNAESSSKFRWPSDMKTGSDLIGDATLRYHFGHVELVENSKTVDFTLLSSLGFRKPTGHRSSRR